MTWLRKLTSRLDSTETEPREAAQPSIERPETKERLSKLVATYSWGVSRELPLHQLHLTQPTSNQTSSPPKKHYTKERSPNPPYPTVSNTRDIDPELDSNMKALGRLRDLPRGTQIDSRIAAIQDLLGEREVFRTLHNLRWPQGVVCPRCRSTNVVRRDPPPTSNDSRFFYECLNCKGSGNPSEFDDLTGLQVENAIRALRQWILCWYLLGFCSVAQIAKVLGLGLAEVAELASLGAHIVELPESSLLSYRQSQARTARENLKAQSEADELRTRSTSLGKYKPGPKSKL
ncbi:MAG: transposase [Gammaproteobacteria bacterium]